MKSWELYEELLKNERRTLLRLKCLSGATAVMFFAVFLITLFGLEIVRKVAKGFRFQIATCEVQNSVLTDTNISCNCGIESCTSHYPCLKVFVTFSANGRDEALKRALLYNNIYDVRSNCTYGPPCTADEKANFDFVSEFKRTKGSVGKSYDCFFNPDAPREVIVDNSVHVTAVFHSIFWPSCVLLVGVGMLTKAFCLGRQTTQICVPELNTLIISED